MTAINLDWIATKPGLQLKFMSDCSLRGVSVTVPENDTAFAVTDGGATLFLRNDGGRVSSWFRGEVWGDPGLFEVVGQ